MKAVANAIVLITAIAAVVLGLYWAAQTGIGKQDQVDCWKWRQLAQTRAPWTERNPGGYWITQAEKEQCNYWGIEVPAVVR